MADTTLISLDEYTGVVAEDPANMRLTVRLAHAYATS